MSRKVKDSIQLGFIYIASAISILSLLLIVGFVLKNGLAHVNLSFLLNYYSVSGKDSGILPMLIGTLYIVLLTLLIATPISIFSAIYLNEYAKDNRITRIIRFAIDGLVSVPSIVYGLFGFSLFVTILQPLTGGYSILSGSLTLTIMILPILIKTIEETLKTIPNNMREASFALGASKVQTIFKVILPTSLSGIINAIILGMGRIISESAPLLLTAGMVYYMPEGIFSSSRTLTTHLYYLASEGVNDEARAQAYATATILIVMIVILNLLTRLIAKRIHKKVGK
ncbi:phosphate transport system permease protein [Breznakia sp. PF5-3]|uniref:phosphate ABC transporter permease PstA n=1 Tax=unclassified Breznakia TaxID=2623764 RepID=UPI002404C33A|nr:MULTISPECIES: phosphate ABC transporter permease PstA [unclassified Breznakia]MDF9825091.1 phosphate transport system permease protein [Breznakia sp. PM6-1]MDF9835932.1 phosphate transport system permease protein [Breznakia sp. PF5-3]MDF9837466.1 phosphate transport system permease protein [Breznakia sp. PFB2-8]MDF9859471.1 phosphate transport system permease protein [Breznakia sp. PH5-24]